MKSMTGYGWSEFQDEKIRMTCEIKSYNNKYLDMSINIPSFLSPFDVDIRKWLKARIGRGRVELTVRVKELEEDIEVIVDKASVAAYRKALAEIADAASLNESPRISHFLKLEGVLTTIKNRDTDRYRGVLFDRMKEAFEIYEKGRVEEGAETFKDIISNLEILEEVLGVVREHEKEMESVFRDNILSRFHELLDDDIDENRVLSETAVLLMKYGIGEEISRLDSHFGQFRKIVRENGPVGKKLDFLCQEINREINTIGSKSTMLEISKSIVGAKDALEKIREQLRNVE